jgi:hypothetical protein
MPTRSLAIAALICVSAPFAAADDLGKAPCALMAEYLRDYARYHPNNPVDTGQFEFLGRAAHISWERNFVPSRSTRVSAINAQTFDTIAAAVQAIGNVQVADDSVLEDNGLQADHSTELRDLRPYSNHIILSQNDGTMHCDSAVSFRVDGTLLEPTSRLPDGAGELCWTAGLTAIRIGRSAYPAIWEIVSDPTELAYSVSLLNPEGSAFNDQDAFCRINLTFQPALHIVSWYPAKNVDGAFLSKVRDVLEPMLTRDTEDARSAHVKALRPKPTGDDPYDNLLRAPDDADAQDLLDVLDPARAMAEIPNVEQESYTGWGSVGAIPLPDLIEIEHHRLLLLTGQPTFGWRTYPDLAFAVWEWAGTKVVPVVSGYLGKRATRPKIAVE